MKMRAACVKAREVWVGFSVKGGSKMVRMRVYKSAIYDMLSEGADPDDRALWTWALIDDKLAINFTSDAPGTH